VGSEADVVRGTFTSAAWRQTADALFEALGVSVTVLDLESPTIGYLGPVGAFCHLLGEDGSSSVGLGCAMDVVGVDLTRTGRVTCRAGLPVMLTPLVVDGRAVCHVRVCGFVHAAKDRPALVQRMIARGVTPGVARSAVRSVPVLGKRRVDSVVRLVVSQAQTIIANALSGADRDVRIRELEALFAARRDIESARLDVESLPRVMLERARTLVDATGGALSIVRPETGELETVAVTGTWDPASLGGREALDEGTPGHVVSTGRSVVISGRDAVPSAAGTGRTGSAIHVPLRAGDRVVGVLSLEVPASAGPVRSGDLVLVERFGQFAGAAIDGLDTQVEGGGMLVELMELNAVGASLGATIDVERIVSLLSSVVDNTFDRDMSGIVLFGWGIEERHVSLRRQVTQGDVQTVLAEALSDAAAPDAGDVTFHSAGGGLVESEEAQGDWSVVTADITAKGILIGRLFIADATAGSFGYRDVRLLTGIASHASVALEKASLFRRMRDDMTKTITALSATLDVNERFQRGHSDRVMDYAMAIGEELGLPYDDIEVLRFAGLLHDIGKIGVSEEILLKPTRLTDDEMAHVRRHAEIGASIVDQIEFLGAVTPVIMHHHERWDGTGYPSGLAGRAVPLLARILAVADSFDAITSVRTFRSAMPVSAARIELEAGAGTQFDPDVVRAFLAVLDHRAGVAATGLFADHVRGAGEARDGHGLPS